MSQYPDATPAPPARANRALALCTRRSALGAALALAGSAVLYGLPRSASAAEATQETLNALANAEQKLADTQAELDRIGAQYQQLSVEQDKTIGQIEDVQTDIDNTQEQIDTKQAELEEKQGYLARRVSQSYKSGNAGTLDLLFSSDSFEDLIANAHYIDRVNAHDKRTIDEVRRIQAELTRRKEELEQQKSELEKLKEQQASQLDDMRAKQDETQAIIDGLSQDVKDLMAQRDAEYLASAQEEERQRQAAAAAAAAARRGTTSIPGAGQAVANAAGAQQRVVAACHSVPSPGLGYCAMWVSQVFSAAGFGYVGGNANDMYNAYCTSSSKANLKVGMVIAVSTHSHTSAGRTYGHIGIYVGDNTVMDNVGYIRTINVDSWISYYGTTVTPRWGWLGGWVLA